MVVGLVICAAQLIGPLGVSGAAAWWVLSAPIDRADALQPAFTKVLVAALLVGLVAAGTLHLLVAPSLWWTLACAGASLGSGLVAVLRQEGHRWKRLTPVGLISATWPIGWLSLGSLGLTGWQLAGPIAIVGLALAVAIAFRIAHRGLGNLSIHQLTASGRARNAMTGALAGADSGLFYDIAIPRLLASGRSARLPSAGRGARALALLDLARVVLRSPRVLLGLPICWLMTAATAALGYGPMGAVLITPVLLLALSGPMSNLRLVVRSPGLARTLPWSTHATRLAASAAAVVICLVWIAGAALLVPPLFAWTMGMAALAGASRWLSSGAPNFGTRIVMTETGPVPIGAISTALRGFDVVALTVGATLIGVPIPAVALTTTMLAAACLARP